MPLRWSKVARSPLRTEIERRLRCGESPCVVSKWLALQGLRVSERTLRSYRRKVLAPNVLTRSEYTYAHDYTNERVDALAELYSMIVVQQQRISVGLRNEEQKGALSSATSADMKTLLKLLKSVIRIEVDLGLRLRQAPSPINGTVGKTDNLV